MQILQMDTQSLPLRADLGLLGRCIRMETNSTELLSLANRWPANFMASSPETIEMQILVKDFGAAGSEDIHHFRGVKHLVFAWLGANNFFTFDLLRKRILGVVTKSTTENSAFWDKQFIPIVAGVLGTTVGLVPVHCAALEKNGIGVLITGFSGAGKSTLSVALAQRGFSLISDDWTYLADSPFGLVAHGLSVPVKLLPDAVRYFPQLDRSQVIKTLNGELAFELNLAEQFEAKTQSSTMPQTLLRLERTPHPGMDFHSWPKSEARDYFEQQAERLPEEIPQARQIRSSIIQQLTNIDCWHIRTGESPHRTADAIDRFCRRT